MPGADILTPPPPNRYDYLPGNGPTLMYLPALNRTRHGETATSLKTWCCPPSSLMTGTSPDSAFAQVPLQRSLISRG